MQLRSRIGSEGLWLVENDLQQRFSLTGMKRSIETVRAKISASEQGLRGAEIDAKKLYTQTRQPR